MKRLVWQLLSVSFFIFFLLMSIVWNKLSQDQIRKNAELDAYNFHHQMEERFRLFERIISVPATLLNETIRRSLPKITQELLAKKKDPFDWTETELKDLTQKFYLSDISILDTNAVIQNSSKNILQQLEFTNDYVFHPNILKNAIGTNRVLTQTPSLNFETGIVEVRGLFGPEKNQNILVSASVNINQSVSINESADFMDYMFFEFFSNSQQERYNVSDIDLAIVKDSEQFSLIGSDVGIEYADNTELFQNKKSGIDFIKTNGGIDAISQITVSDNNLDYADHIILRTRHNFGKDREEFIYSWKVATASLLVLFLVIWAALFYFLSRRIIKSSHLIKFGIQQFTAGNYDDQISIEQNDEFQEISVALNSSAKKMADREKSLLESRMDLEKLVDDRTIALRNEIEQRSVAETRLKEMSLTDHMTKIGNRRHFDSFLASQFSLYKRKSVPFSINLIDIDHFKQTNDLHGHPAGDAVLIQLASLINSLIREYDCFCRIGGEEFAIILPETDLESAKRFAERVLREVRDGNFIIDAGVLKTTVSIGVAELSPRDADEYSLLKRADQALYNAKRSGRDRLELQ